MFSYAHCLLFAMIFQKLFLAEFPVESDPKRWHIQANLKDLKVPWPNTFIIYYEIYKKNSEKFNSQQYLCILSIITLFFNKWPICLFKEYYPKFQFRNWCQFRKFLNIKISQQIILHSNLMEKYRENQIKKISHVDKSTVDYHEIVELLSTIQKLILQNKTLYHSLLDYDPHFNHDLYWPKNDNGLSREIQKQLKLKQIDRLLDQQSFLTQKREQIILKKQFAEENKDQQIGLNKSQFNYFDLKRILGSLKTNNLNSNDRVDELNKIIKQIRNKVDIQIASEKLWIRGQTQLNTPYVSSKKYSKLQNQCYQLESQLNGYIKNNKNLYNLLCEKEQIIERASLHEIQLNKQIENCQQKLSTNQKYINQLQETLKSTKNQLQQIQKGCRFQNGILKLTILVNTPNIKQGKQKTSRTFQQVMEFLQGPDPKRQMLIPDLKIPETPNIKISNSDTIVRRILSDRNWNSREQTSKKSLNRRKEGKENLPNHASHTLIKISSQCETQRINTEIEIGSSAGKTTDRKNPRFKRCKQYRNDTTQISDHPLQSMLSLNLSTLI